MNQPMSEDDKQTFKKGRPYIVGLVALTMTLRVGPNTGKTNEDMFEAAEQFVKAFEKRNGIK